MTIPVMPISYADATPFLENLGGPVAPESWRGALGFTYHIGPGPATAHFALSFDNSTRPLHDVIATIPGSTYPDQWVIYGNHHDGWVNGAHDPISGAASLLETARALGELRKQGWQPKRTIVLALWDGEEFGLLGSTEWAEKHAGRIEPQSRRLYQFRQQRPRHAGRVRFAHARRSSPRKCCAILKDPKNGKSLLETSQRAPRARRGAGRASSRPAFIWDRSGAGSDYGVFIDHLGIASLNVRLRRSESEWRLSFHL